MNAREKWNAMINKIEEMVAVRTRDWREIANKACECGCLPLENDKERNSIFRFMVGNTLEGYINERRDVCAYKYLSEQKEWDWDTALDIACVESNKALIARFQKTFGVRPSYAYKNKEDKNKEDKNKEDKSLNKRKQEWELLSGDKQMCFEVTTSDDQEEAKKFGIPLERFKTVITCSGLQQYYTLNDKEAEFAFQLAEKNSLPFEDVFEYVYNYEWKHIEMPDKCLTPRDFHLEEDLTNFYVLRSYFKKDSSFESILRDHSEDIYRGWKEVDLNDPYMRNWSIEYSLLSTSHYEIRTPIMPDLKRLLELRTKYEDKVLEAEKQESDNEGDWEYYQEFYCWDESSYDNYCYRRDELREGPYIEDEERSELSCQDWEDLYAPNLDDKEEWEYADHNSYDEDVEQVMGIDPDGLHLDLNNFEDFEKYCEIVESQHVCSFKGDKNKCLPAEFEFLDYQKAASNNIRNTIVRRMVKGEIEPRQEFLDVYLAYAPEIEKQSDWVLDFRKLIKEAIDSGIVSSGDELQGKTARELREEMCKKRKAHEESRKAKYHAFIEMIKKTETVKDHDLENRIEILEVSGNMVRFKYRGAEACVPLQWLFEREDFSLCDFVCKDGTRYRYWMPGLNRVGKDI